MSSQPAPTLAFADGAIAYRPGPGIALCFAVTLAAYGAQIGGAMLTSRPWLDSVVLAILLGIGVRSLWEPGARWRAGITFSAKYPLEVAVMLLGASMSTATMLAAGSGLLIGVAAVVMAAILLGFLVGRLLGLSPRLALLIACGSSICGNSAIAAVAAVIEADGDDVTVSIAFTAIFGVVAVLGLPLLGVALGLSPLTYGAFVGLTVYAVPQVIAAASPLGAVAVQMGTLVKLLRVLMLGPVCLLLSLVAPRIKAFNGSFEARVSSRRSGMGALAIAQLVPWFIFGFLVFAACRSAGIIPSGLIAPIHEIASLLTVVSMAALGLDVDLRKTGSARGRVVAAILLSLGLLVGLSCALIFLLHLT